MKVYITSKNTGPTWSGSDPLSMLYIGPSEAEAIGKVPADFINYKKFEKYGKSLEWQYGDRHSIVPKDIPHKLEHFYFADGWWISVVSIEIDVE